MWWEAPSQSVPGIRRGQAEVQESKGKWRSAEASGGSGVCSLKQTPEEQRTLLPCNPLLTHLGAAPAARPWKAPPAPSRLGGVVSAQALLEMQLLPGPCQGPAHVGLEG